MMEQTAQTPLPAHIPLGRELNPADTAQNPR